MRDSPKGTVRQFDDFLGDTLNPDLWVEDVTSTGTAAITGVEIDGTVQLDTAASSGDCGTFASELNWRVQDGALRMEVRVKFDTVTAIGTFVGFASATTYSDILPITISGTTWVTTAVDAIGMAFDTAATTPVVTCMWVDTNADSNQSLANLQFAGLAPVANVYYTYIVELQDNGSGNKVHATFSVIDDKGHMFSKEFPATIDRDTPLCAIVGHESSAATAQETTIDYFEITKSRATSID